MTNRTGARVLTVLSVDGVNAITGQTASPNQSGYVLEPVGIDRDRRLAQERRRDRAVQFHRAAGQLCRAHRPARRTSA